MLYWSVMGVEFENGNICVDCDRFSFFFFQAEDGIRDYKVTGVQTCALPISAADFERDRVECTPKKQSLDETCLRDKGWLPLSGDVGPATKAPSLPVRPKAEIGRASCRERV